MQLPPEGSERCRPGHSSGGMRATPHPYTKNILASGRPNRTNEGEIICANKGGKYYIPLCRRVRGTKLEDRSPDWQWRASAICDDRLPFSCQFVASCERPIF